MRKDSGDDDLTIPVRSVIPYEELWQWALSTKKERAHLRASTMGRRADDILALLDERLHLKRELDTALKELATFKPPATRTSGHPETLVGPRRVQPASATGGDCA